MVVDPDLPVVEKVQDAIMKRVSVVLQEVLMNLDILLVIEAAVIIIGIQIVDVVNALILLVQLLLLLPHQVLLHMKEEKENIESTKKIENTKNQR
jgi:hypothetical protein